MFSLILGDDLKLPDASQADNSSAWITYIIISTKTLRNCHFIFPTKKSRCIKEHNYNS